MISETGSWIFEGNKFDAEHVYDQKVSNALLSMVKRLGASKTYDFG